MPYSVFPFPPLPAVPPILTFILGLAVLALFGWYFTTENSLHKRWLGLTLIVLLVSGALVAVCPPSKKIQLGLDLQGGTEFLIRLVKENPDAKISPQARETAVEVIRSRVDTFGVSEPSITPVGEDSILVQIPGLDAEKINVVRSTLQRVAKLEFRLVDPQGAGLIARVEAGQDIVPPGYQIVTGEDEENETVNPAQPTGDKKKGKPASKKQAEKLLVKNTSDMGGEHITSANAAFGQAGDVEVQVRFDSTGSQQFGRLTGAHIGDRLAILLDGKVVSAPRINSAIYGECQITGSFTETEARNLASALENPLATPVKVESERTVSATLGEDSIKRGVLSGVLGVLITFVFVLVYYRFAGLLANLALLINIVLLFRHDDELGFSC